MKTSTASRRDLVRHKKSVAAQERADRVAKLALKDALAAFVSRARKANFAGWTERGKSLLCGLDRWKVKPSSAMNPLNGMGLFYTQLVVDAVGTLYEFTGWRLRKIDIEGLNPDEVKKVTEALASKTS